MQKLALVAIAAIGFAGVASAQTIMIDGCSATKVAGANYYNFDNPRCVTETEKYSSSKGEDARREREELLAKDE